MAAVIDDQRDVAEGQHRAAAGSSPQAPSSSGGKSHVTLETVTTTLRQVLSKKAALPTGYRFNVLGTPTSVAELRLLPPQRGTLREGPPTNSIVVQLAKNQFANDKNSRQKLTGDMLLARKFGGVSGPIVGLDFVTLGEYIDQVTAEFLSPEDASRVLEQLRRAQYMAGFGVATPVQTDAPSTTISVVDFGGRITRDGSPVGALELSDLFSIAPGDMNVIESFEPGQSFVCFKRAASLYTLMLSPYYSGTLQDHLWSLGLFVAVVHCNLATLTRTAADPEPEEPDTLSPAQPSKATQHFTFGRGGVVATVDSTNDEQYKRDNRRQPAALQQPNAAGLGDERDRRGASVGASSSHDDGGNDSESDDVELDAAEERALTGGAASGSYAGKANDFVQSTTELQLPPELAALLDDNAPVAGNAPPVMPTPAAAPGGLLPAPGAVLAPTDPAAAGSMMNWGSGAPGAAAAPGLLAAPPVLSSAEEPLQPEDAELISSIGSANAEAMKQLLKTNMEKLQALDAAVQAQLATAIISAPTRFDVAVGNDELAELLVESRLVEQPAILSALRHHEVLPKLVSGRVPLSPLVRHLAAQPSLVLFHACLVDLQHNLHRIIASTPQYCANLLSLLDRVPAKAAADADEDAVAAAAQVKQALTQLMTGPVSNVLMQSVAGARLLEGAAKADKIDRGIVMRLIASRIASPAFWSMPLREGMTDHPVGTGLSLRVHLGVATNVIGTNADGDVEFVRALLLLLARHDARKFLLGSPPRIHIEAIPQVIAHLEDAQDDANREFRRSLIHGYNRRLMTTSSASAFTALMDRVPAWLQALGAQYPSGASPFPPLATGMEVGASASNGLYFFEDRKNGGAASYVHPDTKREYVPMPQVYVWERMLGKGDVQAMIHENHALAKATPRPDAKDIAAWLRDQRVRHTVIDAAVINALRIRYSSTPPEYDAEDAAKAAERESGRDMEEGPSRKQHRDERADEAKGGSGGDDNEQEEEGPVPRVLARAMSRYKNTGDPFPALPLGVTASISMSTGYYFFKHEGRRGHSKSTFKHPQDGQEYPATPQALLSESSVPPKEFARDFNLSEKAVVAWYANQAVRDAKIDQAAMDAFGIKYDVLDADESRDRR